MKNSLGISTYMIHMKVFPMRKMLMPLFIVFVILLLSGCRDEFSVHVKCDDCLDKGPYLENQGALRSDGIFGVYLLSKDRVIDARYLSMQEARNQALTHDMFAAFDVADLRPPYIFKEASTLFSGLTNSNRSYQISNINSARTKFDYRFDTVLGSDSPEDLDNVSQFHFKVTYGNKKYKDGVDEKISAWLVDVFKKVPHPVDAVVVVTPLDGVFYSECKVIASDHINNETEERNVLCEDFTALRDYHAFYKAIEINDPQHCDSFDREYGGVLAAAGILGCRLNAWWDKRSYHLPIFGAQAHSDIARFGDMPFWNLSKVQRADYRDEVRELMGDSLAPPTDTLISSTADFDLYMVDELSAEAKAYPISCYANDDSIYNYATKYRPKSEGGTKARFLSNYDTRKALSPVIKFKHPAYANFEGQTLSLLSTITLANGNTQYIKLSDVEIGGIGRGYFKPFSYSEASFHLSNIFAPQQPIEFMDACERANISDVALLGDYPEVVRDVGEKIRIKVTFDRPVKLSQPSFSHRYDLNYLSLRVGNRLVTAYTDDIVTDDLTDEQIDSAYVSGLVFAFTVDKDMYTEQGLAYDEGDELFINPRFASVSDKVFNGQLPTFTSVDLSTRNVNIIPKVDAPRLNDLLIEPAETLQFSESDVLEGDKRTKRLPQSGAFWSPGHVSDAQGSTVIDIAPVNNSDNVIRYLATFTAPVKGLSADDFELVMYNNAAPIAEVLSVSPVQLTGSATRSGNEYVDTYRVTVGNFTNTGIAKLVMKAEASFQALAGGRDVNGVVKNYANMDFADIPGRAFRHNANPPVINLGEVVRSDDFFPNGVPTSLEYTLNTEVLSFTPTPQHFTVALSDRTGNMRDDVASQIDINVRQGRPSYTNEPFTSFFYVTLDMSRLRYSDVDFGSVSLSMNADGALPVVSKWGSTTGQTVRKNVDISAPFVSKLQWHEYDANAMIVKLSTSSGVYVRNMDDLLACCFAETATGERLSLSSVSRLNEGQDFLIKVDTSNVAPNAQIIFDLNASAFPLQGTNGVGVGDTQLSLREAIPGLSLTIDNQAPVMSSELRFTNQGALLVLNFDEPVTGTFPNTSWITLANGQALLVNKVVPNDEKTRYEVYFELPVDEDAAGIQIDYSALRFHDGYNNVADMSNPSQIDNLCLPSIIAYGLDDANLVKVTEGAPIQANMEVKLSCAPTGEVHVAPSADNERLAFHTAPFDGAQMSSLVFTPANWNVPQQIAINAASNGYIEPSYEVIQGFSVTALVNDASGYKFAKDTALKIRFLDNDYWLEEYVSQGKDAFELFEISGPGVSLAHSELVLDFRDIAPYFFEDKRFSDKRLVQTSIFYKDSRRTRIRFGGKAPVRGLAPNTIEKVELYNEVGTVIGWFNIKVDASGVFVTKTKSELVEGKDTSTMTVVLTKAPTQALRLNLQSLDTSEITIDKYQLVFTPENWNVGQDVTVTAVEDLTLDGDVLAGVVIKLAAEELDNWYKHYRGTRVEFTVIHSFMLGVIPPQELHFDKSYRLTLSDYFGIRACSLDFSLTGNLPNGLHLKNGVISGQLDNSERTNFERSESTRAVTIEVFADDDCSDRRASQLVVFNIVKPSDDDDSLPDEPEITPSIVVSTLTGDTDEAGTQANFTVRLASQPDGQVPLMVSVNDASEISVSPSQVVFTPDNWSSPQVVTVTGVDDAEVDGNTLNTVSVDVDRAQLSDTTGYANAAPSTVRVRNKDNDTNAPGLLLSAISGNTSENGATASFTVRLSTLPTGRVDIDVMVSDSTEILATPLSLSFTPDNWNTPQVVTLTGQDDSATDGDTNNTVTVSVGSTGTASEYSTKTANIAVINEDND